MKIVIEKELSEFWLTPEEARGLNDTLIVELVNEDLSELLDRATWTVIRTKEEELDVSLEN